MPPAPAACATDDPVPPIPTVSRHQCRKTQCLSEARIRDRRDSVAREDDVCLSPDNAKSGSKAPKAAVTPRTSSGHTAPPLSGSPTPPWRESLRPGADRVLGGVLEPEDPAPGDTGGRLPDHAGPGELPRPAGTRRRASWKRCADSSSSTVRSPGVCRQIWPTPPSTKSSMPVTKLESLDARKSAAVAISSGLPMVPRGIMATNVSFASLGRASKITVGIVLALRKFTRLLGVCTWEASLGKSEGG